jgi:hypothetical protein
MSSVTTGLIQGPGKIYIAPAGTTLPGQSELAALKGGSLAGWSFLGRTTEPVSITDEPQLVEARSQQTSRLLDVAISGWETSITTTLRDIDEDTVAALLHGATAGDTVFAGLRGATQKFAFAIVGPWDGGECLIVVERGVISNGLELPFNNEEFSTVEFTLQVLEGYEIEQGYEIYIIVGEVNGDE